MRIPWLLLFISTSLLAQSASNINSKDPKVAADNDAIRVAISRFEDALDKQDIAALEPLASTDIVVFENGEINQGWSDFRDNHLTPEFEEPAPKMERKILSIRTSGDLGWGYSEGAFINEGKSGEQIHRSLYTIYVLERKGTEWKILSLTWSQKLR